MTAMKQIQQQIEAEIARAIAKFPTWPVDPLHAAAVLQEEVGELTQSLLQCVYEPHKSTPAQAQAEAVQVAAMVIRLLLGFPSYQFTRSASVFQNEISSIAAQSASAYVVQDNDAKTQPCAPIAQQSLLPAVLKPEKDADYQKRVAISNAIRRVFRHWQKTMDKPAAKLNPPRQRLIHRALVAWKYEEQTLIDAINGCAMTPHNMGIREDGTVGQSYNDLELILRDASHIERFAETAQHPERNMNGKRSDKTAEQIARVFADPGTTAIDSTMYLQNASGEQLAARNERS